MLRAVEAAHTARRSRWEHLRHHPTGASCRWRVKTSCNKNCAAVALRPTYVQQQFQAVHAIPSCMRPYMGGLAKCVRRLGLRRSHDTSGRSPQPSRRHAVAYYCTHHRRKSAVRTNCVPYGGEWLPEAWLHAAHRSGAGGQPGTHRGCHHCRGGRVCRAPSHGWPCYAEIQCGDAATCGARQPYLPAGQAPCMIPPPTSVPLRPWAVSTFPPTHAAPPAAHFLQFLAPRQRRHLACMPPCIMPTRSLLPAMTHTSVHG